MIIIQLNIDALEEEIEKKKLKKCNASTPLRHNLHFAFKKRRSHVHKMIA